MQDPFAMMNNMMGSMMQSFFGGGFGNSLAQMGGGMMQQSGSWGGGGCGTFSCQTMSFSSQVGADGRVHTRQFSSSTVADGRRRLRETKQAYSDSVSGTEKMSMERQIGNRGRKVVRERCEATGEEKETDMRNNISEEECEKFNEDWQREGAPYLPKHRVQLQLEGGSSASSSGHKGGAKGSSKGYGCRGSDYEAQPKGGAKGSSAQGQHRWRASPY